MKIIWDNIGERFYETGVSNGVLYVQDENGHYPKGVAWNGLTNVTESPSGAESSPLYADNIKYLNLISAEEFAATIEAYTYPDEFAECDGSAEVVPGITIGQQKRRGFGLSYRTEFGNDIEGSDYAYKLHLIYGGNAAPSEKGYQTINDTPDAITFSWEIATIPIPVTGRKPTACITINSKKVDPAKLAILEDILYGTNETDPRLPLPDEIFALFGEISLSPIKLVSMEPVDDDDDVQLDSNIVFTFNNRVAREAIIITSETGGIVEGLKSWDDTGKILTFNPADNLSPDTTYIVTIGGVVDIYAQALAPSVTNFMTASE